ncbi:MAG: ABC-F family ATP-binding cassette domain-containing protein [Saprospiraceae bacterium]|nr:ABC-F family ATP-binding cassette domain-containing protein [Saprospiraceae bacterium]MDZ4706455.1 ABC-F family ATP-binding cassette domain-containing protein [Saprospiraceae bacterium]
MIVLADISVKYGERVLLDSVNLVIGIRDKVGLVGRNGTGKSTTMKIIAGDVRPDEGKVSRPSSSTLGFLHQEMNIPKGKTVLDEALTAFTETKALEHRIEEMHHEMETRTDYESEDYERLLEEYSLASDRFTILGGTAMEAEAERVLKGLGFKSSDLQRLTDEFSGGWQMRVELAKMLLQRPDYLLLDEPTNHLDIESIIWLEGFLKTYTGAVIIISHDKQFLDNTTERTIEIELGKAFDYKAPYSKYVAMRAERLEKQLSAYENQQRNIAQKERTIARFMAKASKTSMAQSMQKQLNKIDRIEIDDSDTAVMNLRFPPAPRSGQVVVETLDLEKRYGNLTVLDKVYFKLDRGDRVAFVGQNGQGKTTLAKIIVNEIATSGGQVILGHNSQIGYYAQNQSETLQSNLTLLETMENFSPPEMRTKLRSILGAFLFSGDDVDKKVSVLSGGERARLALACMLLRPFNLLVLDEPTNHLDMLSKDVLKQALADYDGALIVVSHDREFLSGLTNRTLEFRDRQLYDHIGDVNAFLEKRALDNMRQVELSTVNGSSNGNGAAPKRELDREERKRLMRAVQNAERRVETLEKEISEMEEKMAEPAVYNAPDYPSFMQRYEQKKKELASAVAAWEEAMIAVE